MVLDDFRCSPMISKTGKNIEITRLQGSSVSFNELPYITLKASPKTLLGVRFPHRTALEKRKRFYEKHRKIPSVFLVFVS